MFVFVDDLSMTLIYPSGLTGHYTLTINHVVVIRGKFMTVNSSFGKADFRIRVSQVGRRDQGNGD